MRLWAIGLGMVAAASLVGCGATGPRYSQIAAQLPSIEQGQGRIFFYRPGAFGGAVQPDVKLNQKVVGVSQPNSFFFVDRPFGNYRASSTTEVENSIALNVRPDAEIYVQMGISMGLFVGHPTFTLVTQDQAKGDLGPLAYGGAVPVVPRGTATAARSTAPAGAAMPPASVAAPGVTASVSTSAADPLPDATTPSPTASDSKPFAKTSMQDLRQLLPATR